MPDPIRRIAEKHLRNSAHIAIKERTSAADKIRQRHWMVSGKDHKLAALTRILEAETFDGILIFVRTRTMTVELAEKLEARGYACSALSGDMAQKRREETVALLKKGRLDILVAADVAGREAVVPRRRRRGVGVHGVRRARAGSAAEPRRSEGAAEQHQGPEEAASRQGQSRGERRALVFGR